MYPIVSRMLGILITAVLAGCAGQTEQLTMQRPPQGAQQPPPQAITYATTISPSVVGRLPRNSRWSRTSAPTASVSGGTKRRGITPARGKISQASRIPR